MEQYVKYLRKSRFDRDYAELSVEETLKRHEAILDKLAGDRGYHIAKTYYEVVSGESIAVRPEMQKLLAEVSAGLYAGVLVVDVERLARGNSADQAYISQVFQFSGTKIITPLKTYDPGNEFDEEYFEFGLFMSRREYKTINRRLVRGRESSASEGKWINSIAPYGYERVKLPDQKGYTLAPNPEEAEYVQLMFRMYLANKGTKRIANYLNDHKVPTRHGGAWDHATIQNILSNPVYMGKIRRGWREQRKTMDETGAVKRVIITNRDMANYRLYNGLHPPLIDEETFALAQNMRREHYAGPKVRKAYELQNAFAGLLFCAVCGKRVGRSSMAESAGKRPTLKCVNMRNCHNRSAYYHVVEAEIIHALEIWLKGYKVKVETVGFSEEIADCEKQIEALEREREKTEAQLDQTFNLLEQGIYTLEVFQMRREKLSAALEDLEAQQTAVKAAKAQMEENETAAASLVPQTEALLASYDAMTVQERNELLKAILCKVLYFKGADGKITIDLYPRLPKA